MSQMETHIGKMIKVGMNGLSLEEWCKNYCIKQGEDNIKQDDEYTWVECFMDNYEYDSDYKIANNKLYKILNDYSDDGTDIFMANKNSDGSIDYVVQYYNGECYFSEAIGYALDRMKK